MKGRHVNNMVEFRNRDEMSEMKKVVSKTVEQVKQIKDENEIEEELMTEYRRRMLKCKKRLTGSFPKIKKWTHILTSVSIPVALAGTAAGSGLLSFAGVGIAGSSHAVHELSSYFEKKYRWVTFVNEMRE